MKPADIINPLQDTLREFTQGWGEVSVAGDPFNVFEQLTTGPQGLLIVLHWDGDQPAGSARQSPFVKNTVEVYVGRNLGLSLEPGQQLFREDLVDGEKPLSEQAAEIREHLRAFDFESIANLPATLSERRLSYGGCGPVILPGGLPMHAYRLTFNLNTSLPTI